MEITERLKDQLLGHPKGRLKWYFDFLESDIDSLANLDSFIITYCLGLITGETYAVTDYELKGVWQDKPEERENAKEIQILLKNILEGIFTCKDRIPTGDMKIIKDFAQYNDKPHSEEYTKIAIEAMQRSQMKHFIKDYRIKITIGIKNDHVFMEPVENKYKIIQSFLEDISVFPIDSIRSCERPDCQKYFIKYTAKDKRYCSNKCAWVMSSRIRRATDPEKEKEKKRNAYTAKIKKELPGAVIKRRK